MKRLVLTTVLAFGAIVAAAPLPPGWQARLDNAAPVEGVKFEPSGGGFHVTSGPAGIYYKPDQQASGSYDVHASFTQLEPAAHPEAYGLFIGGADLQSDQQKYVYFLVRQDGKFLIKKREGEATPNVVACTDQAAIHKPDASGKATNALGIEVGGDKVRFLVNGTEVASQPKTALETSGIVGVRINHNLNVQVENFGVKPR